MIGVRGGWSHGEVGVGGWSGVEGVRVGVGGNEVGFGGVQVRGLGSGRSEGLGEFGSSWDWGTWKVGALGLGCRVGWGYLGKLGSEELGSGGLGLGKL